MLSRYRETIRVWTDPLGRLLFRGRLRPNHLTLMGFGVSLLAAAAFVRDQQRTAGFLLILAGLFDFFDGSLARASGQVTAFGAFLDSVIDRYSDLVVMLGIVVLFAQMPHPRGALVAMAGLVGSIMVSYTKARAESIGVQCNVGFMERPERMICLIAGAILNLMEPALWVLAIFSNVTALHRIAFTRRVIHDTAVLRALVCAAVLLLGLGVAAADPRITSDTERAWRAAIEAYQRGDSAPVIREFGSETALASPIGDYVRYVLADALARRGDLAAARATAAAIAERHRDSRLAPAALLLVATTAAQAGDEAGNQAALTHLVELYPDARELPEALYLLGMSGEARGQLNAAAAAYRELIVLAPTTGWADGAGDRLGALASAGVRILPLSVDERMDRAERLLRGGVPQTAADEAERVARESRDPGIVVRSLRIVADAAERLGRYDVAARTLEVAINRATTTGKARLQLQQARVLMRSKQQEKALDVLARVMASGPEPDAAEAAYSRARLLEDLGRHADATRAYRAIAKRYATREVAAPALWHLGWEAYLDGHHRPAEETWRRLSEAPGGRAYRLAALYWSGRAHEESGAKDTAERLYARVVRESPRSYYGILAARRAGGPVEVPQQPAIKLPPNPRDAVVDDAGFARVDLLRRIGLVEYAWQELEDVVQRSVGDPVRLYGLSSAYIEEERYHLALRILRRHFAALATTGDPALPPAFWRMLYPFGWRSAVTEAADREGLDPFFVAAIVREESSFYPRAVSRAGARGLMQLMPRTARLLGGPTLAFAGVDGLDDPGLNIQLGARFLADLIKEFRDPRLAAAAYNAGPSRVQQWWKARQTDDIEVFVEQIPYDETRQYVKRVMLSWAEYQRIYGSH
jgi:soluble lytic murein transglycosylase